MSMVSDELEGKQPGAAKRRDADAGPAAPSEADVPAANARSGGESEGADPMAQPAAGVPRAGSAALTTAELQDRWLRAEADLRNLRRRAALEREETRRIAEDEVLLEMIVMLDDLDRALEAARDTGAPESWTAGVKLTADRVRERLQRYGVRVLDPSGAPFDPRFHEALLEIDAPEGAAPGSVVQVTHLGYARGDRALRPARVVVARAPEAGPSKK